MEEKPSNNAEPQSTATEVDLEKAVAPRPASAQHEAEDEFPSGVKVLIIMLAVWLSMFLVALVCFDIPSSPNNIHANNSDRIEQYLGQQYPKSLMIFIPLTTLDGMLVHTCSLLAPFNSSMAESTRSTQQNGSCYGQSDSLS